MIRERFIAILAAVALAGLASACSSATADDAGGGTTGGSDAGEDAGIDAGRHDAGPPPVPDAGCNGIHCGPFTPVCDGKVCRECVQDSDCSRFIAKPYCFRPDSGADDPYAQGYRCFQCVTDADCANNTRGTICNTIDPNPDVLFTCGPDCRADAGPDAGSICLNPNDAGVVDKPYCNVNSGLCANCIGDNDCMDPSKPWCLPNSGGCVQCRDESDCNDAGTTLTPHCLIQTGGRPGKDNRTCVQCRNAYDCPSSIYGLAGCQPAGNTGLPGHYCGKCNAGTDCRAAPGADAGVCLTGFPYSGWVPASCGCDPLAGNSGCGPDAPLCVTVSNGPPPLGICVCSPDGVTDACDHKKGLVCDKQNFLGSGCVPDCQDAGCGAFPNSPVCNPDSGVCVGCLQNSDCFVGGQVCDVGDGVSNPGSNICRATCFGGNGCPSAQPYCGSSGQNPNYCYQCKLTFTPPTNPVPDMPIGCPNDSHGDPEACNQVYNADLLVCF